eukprot:6210016-Pleurochrysis_carterae.AAC.1
MSYSRLFSVVVQPIAVRRPAAHTFLAAAGHQTANIGARVCGGPAAITEIAVAMEVGILFDSIARQQHNVDNARISI